MPPEIQEMLRTVLLIALRFFLIVFPIALFVATYWLLSLPLRRRERAREFLDLLELGLDQDGKPEQALVRVSETRDKTLSVRLHMLALHLREGVSLGEALKNVPRLLPPQVTAMLLVGIETGDLRRVLPACRQVLNDAISQTRGALNYLAVLTFVILPVVPVLSATLSIFVIPKFEQIAIDMQTGVPEFTSGVFAHRGNIVLVQIAVMLCFQLVMLCYICGPRLRELLGAKWIDRVLWLLPWRRHRAHRDFSSMLALLLDAGVPENRALPLAGEASNNHVLISRTRAAADQLTRGVKLTEILRSIDESKELHWRLRNAADGGGGFVNSLRGWFQVLDARAFQQEQAAAQTLTTLLVIWNGFAIALFVIAVFLWLTHTIEQGVLW